MVMEATCPLNGGERLSQGWQGPSGHLNNEIKSPKTGN